MSLTYNQIIKLNRQFAEANHRIKNFGEGEAWDIVRHNQESDYKYPLFWLEPQPQALPAKEWTYSFRAWFITTVPELVDRDTDLMYTNEAEAKSNMIETAKDLLSFWENNEDYPTLRLEKSSNYTVFTDKLEDRVAGCYIDFRLTIPFTYNRCLLPMSGITPPPDTCAPVSIFEDLVLVDTVPSGGSYYYTTTADPVANTMNGTPLTDAISGTTKTFTITYADLSPVVVTTVSDNATTFVGTVPNAIIPTVTPNRPTLTQTVSSGLTYDEKWHVDNGTFDITYPTTPQIQQLDSADSEMIMFDDSATTGITQHLFRFVGSLGGYYDPSDGNYYDIDGNLSDRNTEFLLSGSYYIIDRLSWFGWRGVRGGSTNLTNVLAGIPYSFSGFTDFYAPCAVHFQDLTRFDLAQPLYLTSRPPFDIQLNCWSCTFSNGGTTTAMRWLNSGIFSAQGITGNNARAYIRVHNWGTDDSI